VEHIKNFDNPSKKKILCFVEYYLPGHKSGGPVRTIANFVEYFGDDYEISIICLDRDYLDKEPYHNKDLNKWHIVGKARVFYMSKKTINFKSMTNILNNTSYDLLYLNSFFSYEFTILPLLIRKISLAPSIIPCIIAPRGMLSSNATKLKFTKKIIFLFFANFIGLYRDLFFQASNISEENDIKRNIKNINPKILVAPNLTTVSLINISEIKVDKKGVLRLVFLSRISPMKNLDFLLRSIAKVTNPIDLVIYGNKEDYNYFKKCLNLKKQLPKNIQVSIKDHIRNELVQKVLVKYDLFVLPTRGENFGHVILESLASGIPVLVSDKVFWQTDNDGGIKTLPLDEDLWANEITIWSDYSNEMLVKKRKAALNVASKYNEKNQSLQLNKNLINYALGINDE